MNNTDRVLIGLILLAIVALLLALHAQGNDLREQLEQQSYSTYEQHGIVLPFYPDH